MKLETDNPVKIYKGSFKIKTTKLLNSRKNKKSYFFFIQKLIKI